MDWFRWHHGSVTDPKFGVIAKKSGSRVSDVIAVWAFILESASANDARGVFGGVDVEAIEHLLGLDDGQATLIISAMESKGLIESGKVVAWEKRQPKRERENDNSTERSKAFRDKQRHATPCNATERQETPRGEEKREENKSSRATATRLPADWTPSDVDQDFCRIERPDLDPCATADRFRDYWIAQPGTKGKKLDWSATWRNWVRGEKAQTKPAATVHQLPEFMRGAL